MPGLFGESFGLLSLRFVLTNNNTRTDPIRGLFFFSAKYTPSTADSIQPGTVCVWFVDKTDKWNEQYSHNIPYHTMHPVQSVKIKVKYNW